MAGTAKIHDLLRVLAVITAVLASPSLGQEVLEDPSSEKAGSAVSLYEAAVTIGEYGLRQGDPIILVAAARSLIRIGGNYRATGVRRGHDVEGTGKPTRSDGKRSTQARQSPEARYLAAAVVHAGDDPAIALMIDATLAARARGRSDGPGRWQGPVEQRGYVELEVEFRGAELAEVFVVGDGETDVDLEVLDQVGTRVCKSEGDGDREACRWTPDRTETYVVRVTNRGKVWNFVTVVTN